MTGIEVARFALAHGCTVFRARKDAPGQYDAKPYFTGSRRGWVALDTFTASAITKVHAALTKPENRERFEGMPIQMMAHVAFKLIGGGK